uniref:Large ribosomal subunit protein eL6 n=1 Tax=Acartia pacifica TaxID=335913 RepID=A0A0U2V1L7_ACAPC|nr:60S ribosomal protein L6 [Acartia pacifica]ALS04461.1 60S ribosomal protein L6 [Acartia pacifica]
MAKNKNKGNPRNYTLASGVSRFSKSAMYHKKAIYKFLKKKAPAKKGERKAVFVEKKVGGAKNGETRMVRVRKLANDYPTATKLVGKKNRSCHKSHTAKLRKSLAPGVVAIVLAGNHKGKHVVVLKQLESGLLLVTGPFKLNGCPLRRINQRYVIATKTTVDISGVKVPDTLNDDYFRRVKATENVKKDGVFSENKKVKYTISEQRKKDQVEVDKQVMAVLGKHPESAMMKQYLASQFKLQKGQYPHKMIF